MDVVPDLAELPPDAAALAIANERRHWSPEEVARLRADPATVEEILWGSKGQQVRLPDSPLIRDATRLAYRLFFGKTTDELTPSEEEAVDAIVVLISMILSGIAAIPITSSRYPRRLSGIPNPPLMLYTTGSTQAFDPCVAVSGTRKPSHWGRQTSERLGRRLAQEGWLVTSGLARGIDTAAHRGALSAQNGRTVAVTAMPLDTVYPPENAGLAKAIANRGALVSEHALGRGAGRVEFLRRNRIISGLSAVQIVVETTGSGGTKQQTLTALEQGREVLVVAPPKGEPLAVAGHDQLVQLGAISCASVEEVVDRTRVLFHGS